MVRWLKAAAAASLDLLLSIASLIILLVLVTGGGEGRLGSIPVRAYTCSNLVLLCVPLLLVRWVVRSWAPFLGIRTLQLERLTDRSERLLSTVRSTLLALDEARAARLVWFVIAAVFVLKVLNAWFYFGFYSGDDVEVQEMSLARVFGWDWRAWDLRSPFYPMTFLFPVQRLLVALGVRDAALLVFAGRLVVIGFSSLNLLLVFRIARRVFGILPPAVLAVVFLSTSSLHVALGSSELPRTVSSTFVLLTCRLLLERPAVPGYLVAGGTLAAAACIRFSEGLFALPAAVLLVRPFKPLRVAAFAAATALAAVVILGPVDRLYWGEPFHSLRHIVDYTIVRRESSRGFEPWHWYLTHLSRWTNGLTFGLFLAAVRFPPRTLLPWAFSPLLLLSLLPHKEARYLLPALPFVTTSAAWVAWKLLERSGVPASERAGRPKGQPWWAFPLVAAACVAFLLEADGYRFRRSESAVEMARYLATRGEPGSVAIEQSWKAGGRIYLGPIPLEDVDGLRMADKDAFRKLLAGTDASWIGLRSATVRRAGYEELLRAAGFSEVAFTTRTRRLEYRLFHRPGR